MSFRTIKPAQLSLLFRTVERNRKIYGCFTVLAMNQPANGQAFLRTEASLWNTFASHAPEFTEAGVVKSQPEYLVFGHAYGHGQAEGVAAVRFAGMTKWMRVFGRRFHPDGLRPAPFDKVPLHWRHAWGGPDVAANPVGTGRQRDAAGFIPMPDLEMPEHPWRLDERNPVPAGFGPLEVGHPDRASLVGTYDEAWLKSDFPGMARDADWRFFQVAPLDQRFDHDLRGDEPYDLLGLHPTDRRQEGELPGIRPRVLIERHDRPGLKEIECKLRTIVFLPEAGATVQIWQGITPLADEDGTELRHVLAGFEALARPQPLAHYFEVLEHRLDEQDGMLATLRDEDLLPQGMDFEALIPADLDLNKAPAADSLRARLEKRHLERVQAVRADVASHGLDPDHHAPPLPGPREQLPPIAQLGQYFRELDERARQQREKAAALTKKSLEQNAAEFAARGESFDYVLAELNTTRSGPPEPQTPGLLDLLRQTRAELGSTPPPGFGEIDDMLNDSDLQLRWHQQDQAMQRMYEQSAHFHKAAPRSAGRFAARQKQWIAERLAAGAPLKGFDLTGADFRGIDLRGALLDGAMLEAACFDGVDLRHSSAKGAVLAHASFAGALADDCNFDGANLGKCHFVAGSACRADFSGAILWDADFTHAILRGARLLRIEALHVRFTGADLSEAQLGEMLFYQSDLSGTQFAKASVDGAYFIESTLVGTNFADASACRAAFLKPAGEALCFDGADLSGACFVQEPRLPRASMRGANLSKVFAHAADFTHADFTRARLDGAEFGHADMQGAVLRGVHARGAGLRFANLSGADITGSDLRGALLGNATMHGTRLDATSLYMSDLARVKFDTATSLAGASLGKARLYPRWEPPRT